LESVVRLLKTLLASVATLIPVLALGYGLIYYFEITLLAMAIIGIGLTIVGTFWRWWEMLG
jgi:mannose/fructose/N-acetylgalactosamine-specific phosphotransferase system component IIC